MRTINTFSSPTMGITFKIKGTADCKTRNIIYVIECLKSKIRYVGETENAFHI